MCDNDSREVKCVRCGESLGWLRPSGFLPIGPSVEICRQELRCMKCRHKQKKHAMPQVMKGK